LASCIKTRLTLLAAAMIHQRRRDCTYGIGLECGYEHHEAKRSDEEGGEAQVVFHNRLLCIFHFKAGWRINRRISFHSANNWILAIAFGRVLRFAELESANLESVGRKICVSSVLRIGFHVRALE
jgi:hypothetical protein